MKQFRHFVLAFSLSAVALSQTSQPVITGSCQNGGTYPNCVGGEIVFSGSSYSGPVHVKVTNRAGDVIDESDYTTSDGVLSFVENLSFADTYTVSVNGQAALTVTTQ
jgi:hypothetical protein